MAEAYSQLEVGYEFPPGNYKLDASKVALFLKAVDDTSPLYQDNRSALSLSKRLVPPMAVAALAMATLSNTISLPPGAIHVSQELSFVKTVSLDDNLTSYARLSRTQKRGKLHLITVDLNVRNQNQQTVLTGKTSFILPQPDDEQ
jgi:acyl dehydratase